MISHQIMLLIKLNVHKIKTCAFSTSFYIIVGIWDAVEFEWTCLVFRRQFNSYQRGFFSSVELPEIFYSILVYRRLLIVVVGGNLHY